MQTKLLKKDEKYNWGRVSGEFYDEVIDEVLDIPVIAAGSHPE